MDSILPAKTDAYRPKQESTRNVSGTRSKFRESRRLNFDLSAFQHLHFYDHPLLVANVGPFQAMACMATKGP